MALPAGDRESCRLLTAVISIVTAHEPDPSCLPAGPRAQFCCLMKCSGPLAKSVLELTPQLLGGILKPVTASCQFSGTGYLCPAEVTAASPIEAGLEWEAHTFRPGRQGGVFSSRGCACFLLCMVEDGYCRPEPVRVPGSLRGGAGVGRA